MPRLLPTEMDGKDDTEALLQSLHIPQIVFGRLIPLAVTLDLRIGRETTHSKYANQPVTGESRGWERPPTTASGVIIGQVGCGEGSGACILTLLREMRDGEIRGGPRQPVRVPDFRGRRKAVRIIQRRGCEFDRVEIVGVSVRNRSAAPRAETPRDGRRRLELCQLPAEERELAHAHYEPGD